MITVNNEKKFKCIPQNLSMSEAAPVCQPWSYASDHPMESMLAPHYFLSAYDRLRPGDTIRVVQMKDPGIHTTGNAVIEFSDMIVVKSSRDEIVTHLVRRVNIDEMAQKNTEDNIQPTAGDVQAVRRWNPGKKEHEAVAGEGADAKVLFSHADKEEVDKWLQQSE